MRIPILIFGGLCACIVSLNLVIAFARQVDQKRQVVLRIPLGQVRAVASQVHAGSVFTSIAMDSGTILLSDSRIVRLNARASKEVRGDGEEYLCFEGDNCYHLPAGRKGR